MVDARDGDALERAGRRARRSHRARGRRRRSRRTARRSSRLPAGPIDLLVNNASVLGPTPLPALADYPLDALRRVYEVNVLAPLALVQLALPAARRSTRAIVNVTSDAAVEPYEGWGGYGSSKAALEQLTAILAAEHPGSASTRSIRATCARGCTRRRSPARTSPTGRRRRRAFPACSR